MFTKILDDVKSTVAQTARLGLSRDDKQKLEIGSYAKNRILPRNLPADDPKRYVPSLWFDEYGLEFNLPGQLLRLKRWGQDYQPLFNSLRADPSINKECLGETYLYNEYYPTPDAEIYAAMILDIKPEQIIEVGSGFSTLIARKSIEAAGLSTRITVIDPSPRTNVSKAADRVLSKFVEDLEISEIGISNNTLLFIDSSHVCRGRGDVPFLYCNLIPKLPSGVFVHVHDIFLPYDYPIVFLKKWYTEQYLLYPLLLQSERYELVFTTHYLSRKHAQEMQATFGPIVGADNRFFGASLWFRIK